GVGPGTGASGGTEASPAVERAQRDETPQAHSGLSRRGLLGLAAGVGAAGLALGAGAGAAAGVAIGRTRAAEDAASAYAFFGAHQ
ncbi:hypothetical protein ACC848_41825, partial [Rhizobium johnstonii]